MMFKVIGWWHSTSYIYIYIYIYIYSCLYNACHSYLNTACTGVWCQYLFLRKGNYSLFSAEVVTVMATQYESYVNSGQTVHVHLNHWGRVSHVCVNKLTITGSDNGLSPGRHQVIIWTNTGILLIGSLETNFSDILIEIRIFQFH